MYSFCEEKVHTFEYVAEYLARIGKYYFIIAASLMNTLWLGSVHPVTVLSLILSQLTSSIFPLILFPTVLERNGTLWVFHNENSTHVSSVFRHHATHAIARGPAVQGGPRGTRFLQMGIENRHFFGPVCIWVNTGLPISLRTHNTVIDTCVVLSPYFCVNGELEAVLINRSQAVFRQMFGKTCSGTVSNSVRRM